MSRDERPRRGDDLVLIHRCQRDLCVKRCATRVYIAGREAASRRDLGEPSDLLLRGEGRLVRPDDTTDFVRFGRMCAAVALTSPLTV